jgi:hypothetical protein
MSRQKTFTGTLEPTYTSPLEGKLKLANITHYNCFLIAGYVPDLEDVETRKRCIGHYMHPMNLVRGERLADRIYKRVVRNPESSELEYVIKASDAQSAEAVRAVLKKIEKNPFSFEEDSFGEKVDIALWDLAIGEAKRIWHSEGFRKIFPAMYQLAVLEGHLGDEDERKTLEPIRDKVIRRAQKAYERDLGWTIKKTKSEIDNFEEEVNGMTSFFGGNLKKARRAMLMKEFSERYHCPPQLLYGFSDYVVIVNREVTKIVTKEFPGAELAELDSFDSKGNVNFKIVYSPDAPPVGQVEEIPSLSNLFGS